MTGLVYAHARDGVRLALQLRGPASQRPSARILLVHGFGQNRFSFDLPGRSLVEYLSNEGFETAIAELRGHGLSRGGRTARARHFDDYVQLDFPALLDAFDAHSAAPQAPLFVIGHSMGGLCALSAPEQAQQRLAGIIGLAAPLHFGLGNRAIGALARAAVLTPGLKRVPNRMRVLPLPWLRPPIEALLPRIPGALTRLPLELWAPGSIEPRLLRRYLDLSFDHESMKVLQDFLRWGGTRQFRSADGALDFRARVEALTLPLLLIAGDRDSLAPPATLRPAMRYLRSPDLTVRTVGRPEARHGVGHLDIVVGHFARTHIWPLLADWIARRA